MDESAFVTILDVSDIIGDHIKSRNKIKKLSWNLAPFCYNEFGG